MGKTSKGLPSTRHGTSETRMAATGNLKNRAIQTIDRLRRRSRWFDLAVRGFGRYQRTEGPVSAVHVAYSAFFSIFPLLFVAVGVPGVVRASGIVFRALGVGGTPAKVSSVALTVALGFVVDVALFTLTFVLLPN